VSLIEQIDVSNNCTRHSKESYIAVRQGVGGWYSQASGGKKLKERKTESFKKNHKHFIVISFLFSDRKNPFKDKQTNNFTKTWQFAGHFRQNDLWNNRFTRFKIEKGK